jgi:MFS family permease
LVTQAAMQPKVATGLVFAAAFCVLVLEIVAGRLLAPLIGVSLETFTGIIGTVLAGIAVGSAVGGRLADRVDPARLIGPAFLGGGLLTWTAPVLISITGPVQSPDPVTIVFLTAISFFGPAAVLSAVTPMVAKLQLRHLGETGTIVGRLSAAGTAGALAGTFLTGFVLVAAVSTRTIVFGVGVFLVVLGALLTGWQRLVAEPLAVVLLVAAGAGALLVGGPCDAETAYACVELVADPARPAGRSVVLNGVRSSYVDLDDPSHLEFRYMRLFADVTETLPAGPVEVLHLGGAGFTYPRYVEAVRPGSRNLVLEIDGDLVDLTRDQLGLELTDDLQVVVGDARLTTAGLEADRFDLVVGDAFSGLTIPWHLTTAQYVAELDRVLQPDGLVVANLIDGGDADFARAELATYATRFDHVTLIVPSGGIDGDLPRNLILIASHQPIGPLSIAPPDGRLLGEEQTAQLIGDAIVLDDDYAPVDQLRLAR